LWGGEGSEGKFARSVSRFGSCAFLGGGILGLPGVLFRQNAKEGRKIQKIEKTPLNAEIRAKEWRKRKLVFVLGGRKRTRIKKGLRGQKEYIAEPQN